MFDSFKKQLGIDYEVKLVKLKKSTFHCYQGRISPPGLRVQYILAGSFENQMNEFFLTPGKS